VPKSSSQISKAIFFKSSSIRAARSGSSIALVSVISSVTREGSTPDLRTAARSRSANRGRSNSRAERFTLTCSPGKGPFCHRAAAECDGTLASPVDGLRDGALPTKRTLGTSIAARPLVRIGSVGRLMTAGATWVVLSLGAPSAQAYGVLTHLALVDAAWDDAV